MNWISRAAGALALTCLGSLAGTQAEAQFGTGTQGPSAQLPGGRAGDNKREAPKRLDPSQDATKPLREAPPAKAKKPANDEDDEDDARKAKAGAKKKLDTAAVSKTLDAAAKQIAANKAEVAIKALNGVVATADLPSGLMARALYLRGAAHRKQGRSAQAIADLTGALWLKNGLSGTDRADAAHQRSATYRDAGLPEPAEVVPQRTASPGKDKPNVSSWQTGSTGKQRTEGKGPAKEEPSKGGGLGSFFGNIFGGGDAAKPAPQPSAPPKTAVPTWETEVTPKKSKRDDRSS